MKLFVLLLVIGFCTIIFASPASRNHAMAFEPWLDYQDQFFHNFSKQIAAGLTNPIKGKYLRELNAKKSAFEAIFGADIDTYNQKFKKLCLPAFMSTDSGFSSLYNWGLSAGTESGRLFQTDYKEARAAVKQCKK